MTTDLLIAIVLTASAAFVVWTLSSALPGPTTRRIKLATALVAWFAVIVALGATRVLAPETARHAGRRARRGRARRGLRDPRHADCRLAGGADGNSPPRPRRGTCRARARNLLPDPSRARAAARALRADSGMGRHHHRRDSAAGRLDGGDSDAGLATRHVDLECARACRSGDRDCARRDVGPGFAATTIHRRPRNVPSCRCCRCFSFRASWCPS